MDDYARIARTATIAACAYTALLLGYEVLAGEWSGENVAMIVRYTAAVWLTMLAFIGLAWRFDR